MICQLERTADPGRALLLGQVKTRRAGSRYTRARVSSWSIANIHLSSEHPIETYHIFGPHKNDASTVRRGSILLK